MHRHQDALIKLQTHLANAATYFDYCVTVIPQTLNNNYDNTHCINHNNYYDGNNDHDHHIYINYY